MNARVAAAVVGIITVLLGLAALLYPERTLGMLGLAVQNAAHTAAALGEVRATYGGVFVVLGVYTVVGAFSPWTHRGRLTMLGLVWLGAAAGRLVGVSIDGNPGLFGWIGVLFEVVMGTVLLAAAASAAPPAGAVAPAVPVPTG